MKLLEVAVADIGTDLAHLKQWPEAPAIGDGSPLIVVEHDGRYILVDGFKRLAALRARGCEKAWVQVIAGDLRSAKAKLLTLNSPRKTATLYEEILVVEELSEKHGMSEKAIARLLGHKLAWVRARLAMSMRLRPELRALIADGKLRIRVALRLAELPGDLALRAAVVIERERLADKEAREFLQVLGMVEDRDALLADPRREMVRLSSPSPPEDPQIVRLRRLREELRQVVEDFSHPPQDPHIFVELKRVAWAVAELAPLAGEFLALSECGGRRHDSGGDTHRRAEAGVDGARPPLDRPSPEARPKEREGHPSGARASSQAGQAPHPGPVPRPDPSVDRGGQDRRPDRDRDLPAPEAGGIHGRAHGGGRVRAVDPAPSQAPGVLPLRDGSGRDRPDRLVSVQAPGGSPEPGGPRLLDGPRLVALPVPGVVPG